MTRRDYGSGSIKERSPGRWRIELQLSRDPLTGKRRRRRFTVRGAKRDAQRALREALTERDHGINVNPDRLDLSTYLDRWLTGARHTLKLSTLDGYERDVRNHYKPVLGGRLLRDLRAADIQAFVDRKLEEGLSAWNCGELLAVATFEVIKRERFAVQ